MEFTLSKIFQTRAKFPPDFCSSLILTSVQALMQVDLGHLGPEKMENIKMSLSGLDECRIAILRLWQEVDLLRRGWLALQTREVHVSCFSDITLTFIWGDKVCWLLGGPRRVNFWGLKWRQGHCKKQRPTPRHQLLAQVEVAYLGHSLLSQSRHPAHQS